jgi:hypothetical protein
MNDTFFPRKQTVEIVSKTKPARAENGMQASIFLGKLDHQGVLCNELTPLLPGRLRASLECYGWHALPG